MATAATQNSERVEFVFRPNLRRVSGKFGVAFITWKPFSAAFELDRDNIVSAVIMSAPRFIINVRTDHVHVVDLYFQ